MKNGLIYENGELIYYKDDRPRHAGVIKEGKDIYYIGRHGRAVKGRHIVHGEMANGILARGTYTFGEDYKLVKRSYIAPKKIKKRKKKKTVSRKFVLIPSLIALLLVVAVAIHENFLHTSVEPPKNDTDAVITLPTFKDEVLLCAPIAKKFYDGETSIEKACEIGNPYRPLSFNYNLGQRDGLLLLSEQADLSNAREYVLDGKETVLQLQNLKTDTTYYYQVTVEDKTYDGSFKTVASTRFVSIPGLYNTRDIGGTSTQDGKTIKQGLLIRGTELDGLVEPTYFLETANIPAVQQDFGFVCDLDLRSHLFGDNYTSRLGENVKHTFYGAPAYGEMFSSIYFPALKQLFAAMADPTNYPMYVHCTYGADRTGTLIYLLQGVLGVSEEDMRREYFTTSFAFNGYDTTKNLDVIDAGLQNFPGDTLQDQIISFLTDTIGVTQEEIDSIRNILLEE